MVSRPPPLEAVDLPGGTSVTCYPMVDRVEIHPGPVGEVEVRLSGGPAGAAIVLRLDPDRASQLAAALSTLPIARHDAAQADSARMASQKETYS